MTPLPPELLSPILEFPDDDGRRLIAADWWQENGEEERAEFIRVQCRLADLETERGPRSEPVPGSSAWAVRPLLPDEHELDERHRALIAANYGRWLPGDVLAAWPRPGAVGNGTVLRQAGWTYTEFVRFRRGFIEEAALPAADWLAHAAALRAEHPITRVRLTTWPQVVRDGRGRLRLDGDRWWFSVGQMADECERLTAESPPTLDAVAYWQHDAHILCRLRWPGVEFELPPEPTGGLHVPPEFVQALLQAADSGEPIIGDPVTIMFPNPDDVATASPGNYSAAWQQNRDFADALGLPVPPE